jgi:hypothetical protein
MIDANAYRLLLEQPGCVGVPIYFALDQGVLTIAVVGVDYNENDMTNGIVLDGAHLSPPKCPASSPLMRLLQSY